MNRSVIHVVQPTDGGVPHYVAALARYQLDAGWRVEVAAPSSGPLRGWLDDTDVNYLTWEAKRDPGPSIVAETAKLRILLRTSEAAFVHLHSAKAGAVGRWVLKGRRPTVFQPHSWTFEAVPSPLRLIMTRWERLAARWSDRIVCVSEGERQTGRSAGIRARWAVVPNGVDLSKWQVPSAADRDTARTRLRVAPGPLVVSVGRVRHQKGHDLLLDAWPSVLERVPDAQLVIVGDGPERGPLMLRSVPSVSFVGEISDAREWIVAADLIALPSRYEGMSLAMLEAMASATSVVTTEVAGAREAMGSESGAIVAIEDRTALAEAIGARLLDPELAGAEGRTGRLRVERHHSFQKAAEEMTAVYEAVAAEREPSLTSRSGSADH
jgi:glycosyltransferase involved in cell wall biosynthesis